MGEKDKKQGRTSHIMQERILYALDLIAEGYTYRKAIAKIKEKFGLKGKNEPRTVMVKAYESLRGSFEEEAKRLKDVNLTRLFKMYEECNTITGVRGIDMKLKILNEINKMYGLYEMQKVDVKVDTEKPITFQFGTTNLNLNEDNE